MILRLDIIHATICGSEPLATAVQMLVRARQYAERANCNPWHFAVELDEFHRAGVRRIELRFLLMADLVEHAQEVIDFDHSGRKLKRLPKHVVPADACFILSDLGSARLSKLTNDSNGSALVTKGAPKLENGSQQPPPIETSIAPLIPQWDAAQKVLRFNGVVVKRFPYPAPNQEVILAAFEEETWPQRIDNPLRPTAEEDVQTRLHDTIKCLNRKMINAFIRFCGDGTGTGIVWRLRTGKD